MCNVCFFFIGALFLSAIDVALCTSNTRCISISCILQDEGTEA